MNKDNFDLCTKLIGGNYVAQGESNRRSLEKKVHHLLEQRKLPEVGWTNAEIRHFISELSLMDSNNFPSRCGVGEREGRVLNDLVAARHFNLAHGIGRSGDIAATQPKAAGSSVITKLANALVLDLVRMAGVPSAAAAAIIPSATGMTLTLCLLFLKKQNPRGRLVVWPRIDQKSCFKAMLTAGLEPLVVEPEVVGDELRTNLAEVERLLDQHGDEVLAVMTTTSCFAPRVCDRVVDVAELCRRRGVAHLVNNAYGVQARRCMNLIQKAQERGRVDVFVQSTDKNVLVPVGGAFVASASADTVASVCRLYPGRAAISPSLDVLITLLGLGRRGLEQLFRSREECLVLLREKVAALAASFGERLLGTPGNPISLAMTLARYPGDPNELGSMLFTRGCSGARVVAPGSTPKSVEGHTFARFGSHCSAPAAPYLNCAAALGQSAREVEQFVERLGQAMRKKYPRSVPSPAQDPAQDPAGGDEAQ